MISIVSILFHNISIIKTNNIIKYSIIIESHFECSIIVNVQWLVFVILYICKCLGVLVTVMLQCFFFLTSQSPYLARSICWHTENTHYWLLAAAHRCCWGYHSLLPFQGSLFRLLNRHTHTHTHVHTCTRFHIHSNAFTHTHLITPSRLEASLQVNRCMLLSFLSGVWKWCMFCFLFPADCIWRCGFIKRCDTVCFVPVFFFLFSVLIIALLCVWHVGIFLFSRK